MKISGVGQESTEVINQIQFDETCPPHYGYRYGRWYYGPDHIWGCEFGGNKGSGSMD